MATKSKLGASVPKPANQGGHSGVNVQPAKIQSAPSLKKPGSTAMNYTKQPAGTKGTNPGAK
jgi:hypothetical protein